MNVLLLTISEGKVPLGRTQTELRQTFSQKPGVFVGWDEHLLKKVKNENLELRADHEHQTQ